jgi:hypothetical protein
MVRINGRWYIPRNDLNAYKARLLAAALGVEPVAPAPDDRNPLIPLRQVATELGVGRRTVGTRMAAVARAALAATESVAA